MVQKLAETWIIMDTQLTWPIEIKTTESEKEKP